jgi:hypothetical protein
VARHLLVFSGEEPGQRFEQGDPDAVGGVDVGKLHPHGPGPDDDQRARSLLEPDGTVGGEDRRLVDDDARKGPGLGARGENDGAP